MNKGSLIYNDYKKLIKNKNIISQNNFNNQIQPSSLDLTLSEEGYEVKASFLSANGKVRERLKKIFIKKINLEKEYIFKKNITYIVKLNEELNLSDKIFGRCNQQT